MSRGQLHYLRPRTDCFPPGGLPAQLLKDEFKDHFRNVSRIMDCVGCDKCRLWGKLQVTGLGTALKLLFSYDGASPLSSPLNPDQDPHAVVLSRSELVAFVNTLHRLSESLAAVDKFRSLWAQRNFKEDGDNTWKSEAKQDASPAPPMSEPVTPRIGDVVPLQGQQATDESSRQADAAASTRSAARKKKLPPSPAPPATRRHPSNDTDTGAGASSESGSSPLSLAATIWTRLITMCEGGWSRCIELVGRTSASTASERATSDRDEL